MRCDQAQERLPALADKTLGEREVSLVSAHLRSCPECASAWARHEEIERFFKEDPGAGLPDSYWAHSRRTILDQVAWGAPRESTSDTDAFSIRRRGVAIGMAAAAALFIAVLTVVLSSPGKPPEPADPVAGRTPGIEVESTPDPTRPEETSTPSVSPDPLPSPEPTPDVIVRPEPSPLPSPSPDVIVRPEPSPTPEPSAEPEPSPEVIVRPEPSASPKPSPSPEVRKAPPAWAVAVALPGDNGYGRKLAGELTALVASRNDAESVDLLLLSARARLQEMGHAANARPQAMTELVDAYVAIVGEGADTLLTRKPDAKTKARARAELQEQLRMLQELEGVDPAISACRTVADFRSHYATFRSKGKDLRLLPLAREMAKVGAARTVDERVKAGVEVCQHRLADLAAAMKGGNAAAAAEASESYDSVLDRGLLAFITRLHAEGLNIGTPRAIVLKALRDHLAWADRALKGSKDGIREAVAGLSASARAVRDRLNGLADPEKPEAKPKPAPGATPAPSGEPTPEPSPSVDPGFDPNENP